MAAVNILSVCGSGTLDKITDDGKKHKQGDIIVREAFGVVIETKF